MFMICCANSKSPFPLCMEQSGEPPRPKRKTEPDPSQGERPGSRNPSYVDAVHDAVQESEELGHEHGESRLKYIIRYFAVGKVYLFHKFKSLFQFGAVCRVSRNYVTGKTDLMQRI